MAHSEVLIIPEGTESWNLEDDALMYLDDRKMNVDYMTHNTECVLSNSEELHLINQAN
jgi:hypothetical protein